METKMWSYKLAWDTMFAPNPLFDVLTLATCKPTIRKSPNNQKGMWIAGFTACTTHNSPAFGEGIFHCKRGEEKLIYLAQISDIIPLDDYWEQYPQKRCAAGIDHNDARYYGDNIYTSRHTDENGNVVSMYNYGGHDGPEAGKRDYHSGKNAIICKRFYYFTPDKRMDVPNRFKHLVHGARGQSIKTDGVEEFIAYVAAYAAREGVNNGIVGHIPVSYSEIITATENGFLLPAANDNSKPKYKKKGCSK